MKILINAMVVSPASWIKYVTLSVTFGTSQGRAEPTCETGM